MCHFLQFADVCHLRLFIDTHTKADRLLNGKYFKSLEHGKFLLNVNEVYITIKRALYWK
jgi:hypothetical protein